MKKGRSLLLLKAWNAFLFEKILGLDKDGKKIRALFMFTTVNDAKEKAFFWKPSAFEDSLKQICADVIENFKKVTRYYALFHMVYFGVGFSLLFSFLLFFSFFTKSAMLAFFLAALFLTVFSYFVLLFYFQAKKPEQLAELKDSFVQSCKQLISFEESSAEYHLAISTALSYLAAHLERQEYSYYVLPKNFKTLSPLMEKFSVWTHWKDLHQMKEMLLLLAIKEHIYVVKKKPTDLEAHAALANKFIDLSRLYKDPRKEGEALWVPVQFTSPEMKKKFQLATERAIEEFKILNSYSPENLWVHAQLALLYHQMEKFEEEIFEYETLLRLSPNDKEVLFRLGVLYFQQGYNAKGLKIYDMLKKTKDEKSEELVSFYDSFLKEFEKSYSL